jgi:hypothetical protein
LAQGLGVAVAVLVLQVGVRLTGATASYPFAFVIIGALMLVCVIEAIRLPGTAGESIGGKAAARKA